MELEAELSEAEGYLRALDVEFKTMSATNKRLIQAKMTEYRDEYQHMIKKYRDTKSKAEDAVVKTSEGTRKQIYDANKTLDKSTVDLLQSKQLVARTEQTGFVIMDDLENQRDKLTGANAYVKDTKQYTIDARKILKNMGQRAVLQKLGMYLLIVALLAIIVVELVYGFKTKKT